MVNGPEMIVFEKNGLAKEVQFVVNGPVMTVLGRMVLKSMYLNG